MMVGKLVGLVVGSRVGTPVGPSVGCKLVGTTVSPGCTGAGVCLSVGAMDGVLVGS